MAKRRVKDSDLLELAKRGAEVQLNDLMHELKMLIELFPHLRDSYDSDELPVKFLLKRGSERAERRLAKRVAAKPGWTTAKRRAAATRMKKYWADRRRRGE